jgi:hypothetical protein
MYVFQEVSSKWDLPNSQSDEIETKSEDRRLRRIPVEQLNNTQKTFTGIRLRRIPGEDLEGTRKANELAKSTLKSGSNNPESEAQI